MLARGCSFDAEQEIFLVGDASPLPTSAGLDDGALLRTLTHSVAQLERQPLSINMNKEIEAAQAQIVLNQDEEAVPMQL